MIFDVGNWCIFGGKYFVRLTPNPNIYIVYIVLLYICLNYFPHSFNMLKWYKINFSWIQASPQGPVVNTITLLVAYICLSPGFLKMSGISRALTDRLCANRWPYRLGWGPVNWVKVRVGCKQGSCKLIVSKNLMCTQPCVILCWINSS